MASFQDSVKASKEAGQANSEILDIMSESVDGKLNGSFSIPKNDANSYKFRHEHPKEIEITNVETPSIHKRKAGAFSGEKQSRNNKSQRQGSPGLHVEREEVPFDNPFNQTVSPFTICLNKFASQLIWMRNLSWLKKYLTGTSLNSLKDLQRCSKINKKPIFLKNAKFTQNEKQLQDLFKEINLDVTILKSTFYPSGNIKILPKTTNNYLLVTNYTFSNMFSRLTKNHISIEESCNLSSNSTLCLNKISISTMLEEVEEAFIHQDTPFRNLTKQTDHLRH